ncbi:MAG TPA: hypothetical protein VLY83_03605 [Methanoregula sp.]|nr:hypothetical protein [Methanoregula sp.]
MTTTPEDTHTALRLRLLEIAVPVIAFGGTFLGVLAWRLGYGIAFPYFSAGCVLASFDLAYLAWVRPKKDIVALTTPVYAIIFFFVPNDFSGVFLQFLFSASLTVLLIRLKVRFGSPGPRSPGHRDLPEEVGRYVELLREPLAFLSEAQGLRAEEVFSLFAQGEYRDAARKAEIARKELPGAAGAGALGRAYEVIGSEALQLDRPPDGPADPVTFLPRHAPFLAREIPAGADTAECSGTALDCALLLVFAAAWVSVPAERENLKAFREFAGKLIAG